MKEYVAFYFPTGYRANGEKIPHGKNYGLYESPTISLIKAQSRTQAEEKARNNAPSIYDEDIYSWKNPPVVNICIEHFTPGKQNKIYDAFKELQRSLQTKSEEIWKLHCRIVELDRQISVLKEMRSELERGQVALESEYSNTDNLVVTLETLSYLGVADW